MKRDCAPRLGVPKPDRMLHFSEARISAALLQLMVSSNLQLHENSWSSVLTTRDQGSVARLEASPREQYTVQTLLEDGRALGRVLVGLWQCETSARPPRDLGLAEVNRGLEEVCGWAPCQLRPTCLSASRWWCSNALAAENKHGKRFTKLWRCESARFRADVFLLLARNSGNALRESLVKTIPAPVGRYADCETM